jgi:sugar O-acyltransferase (sialic acid O-acetyltransferase NeuD family)
MAKKNIVIIGAGGFAREVRWLISEINHVNSSFQFLGYIVSDLSRLTDSDSKPEVLGDYGWLQSNATKVDCLAIGIGTPSSRLKISRELEGLFPKMDWPALIHPTVRFHRETSKVGKGVILCAGVIGTVNLVIEDHSMVNLACTLGHESIIGKGSVLNPTVNISGGVHLGEGVLVGTGAQILQYVHIGAGATVGAGAVVTKNVEPGQTVVGIPAKPLAR